MEPKVVRYIKGNTQNNRVLKAMLIKEWGSRCYWCGAPKQFNELAIDHIVAESMSDARIAAHKVSQLIPDDFDINAPTNLAPICSPCNTGKRDNDVLISHKMESSLIEARTYAPKVINHVLVFDPSNKLAEAFLKVTEADLTVTAMKDIFDDFGPLALPKLAYLLEQEDYELIQGVALDDRLNSVVASARLDQPGLRARSIVKELCGIEMSELLEQCTYHLFEHLEQRVESEFDGMYAPNESPISTNFSDVHYAYVSIYNVRYELLNGEVLLTFEGDIDGAMSTTLAINSDDGSTVEDAQGDSTLIGKFTVQTSLLMSRDNDFDELDWWVDMSKVTTELDVNRRMRYRGVTQSSAPMPLAPS